MEISLRKDHYYVVLIILPRLVAQLSPSKRAIADHSVIVMINAAGKMRAECLTIVSDGLIYSCYE